MAALTVFNTLSRKYEKFVPLEEGKVSIYVCGITPYDHSHIGHARPAVFWDVVRRYLTYKGYNVTFVTNFTDIDDKLINKSKQTGIPIANIAEKYAQEYLESVEKLGVQKANIYPKASQVIPEIINAVKVLIDKGFAYESSGDVYFRAEEFKDYGKLSGRKPQDLMPGARVAISELKESPLDWALWKSSSADEPGWHSPWGRGRPGWHIECSVMVDKYLGSNIDMHGGGSDLIFPHHENEIAQAEAFSGSVPYVKYWLHSEMLNIEGDKMSKSVGNIISLSEIITTYIPMAVRLYLLSGHRRKSLEFSDDILRSAEKGWERIQIGYNNALNFLINPLPRGLSDASKLAQVAKQCREAFFEAMDNDFNTPKALAAVFDLINTINAQIASQEDVTSDGKARQVVAESFALLVQFLGILGLSPKMSSPKKLGENGITQNLIDILIDIRNDARNRKDYEIADYIRDRVSHLGITLEDTATGTNIRM